MEAPRPGGIDGTPPIAVVTTQVSPRLVHAQSLLEPPVVVPVRVRVAAGNQLLFDDTLRIARNASASFNQNRSEAPERFCSTGRNYGNSERYSLNLQLYLSENPEEGSAVNVSVTWQRPSGTAACGPDGSRSVSLSETVPLKAGQSARLEGDAGLVVTLSRR